jgi:cyanate lyase
LERRVKDLLEERATKDRRFQNVQDENVALELELNMALQREEALKKDNHELLDRWMQLKKEEADEMNRASKWE